MQWARDADRLPNGHTLVTDSNGDRVFEIGTDGEVVWSATVGFPYESERLGTGDESAGGESAAALELPSRSPDASDATGWARLEGALPTKIVNGISYLFPRWVGAAEGLALLVLAVALPAWLTVEYRRADVSVGVRSPLRFDRK
jgi:hypothetical protein